MLFWQFGKHFSTNIFVVTLPLKSIIMVHFRQFIRTPLYKRSCFLLFCLLIPKGVCHNEKKIIWARICLPTKSLRQIQLFEWASCVIPSDTLNCQFWWWPISNTFPLTAHFAYETFRITGQETFKLGKWEMHNLAWGSHVVGQLTQVAPAAIQMHIQTWK